METQGAAAWDDGVRLNGPQRDAVRHTQGPLLILAGAGSGKTRVITHRIARLIMVSGVRPRRILAVTFTNKAAREMQHRVEALLDSHRTLGERFGGAPRLSTFHALGARLLREFGDRIGLPPHFTICDEADQQAVLRDVVDAMELELDRGGLRQLWDAIDDAKNKGWQPDMCLEQAVGGDAELRAEVYRAYQAALRAQGVLDFGDLILEPVRLLETCPDVRAQLQRRWRYVMVDEFQDTNPCQYALLRHLVGSEQNLAVVGDDDQAIYRWRGATVRNILDFERDYPDARVVKLEQNYRSCQAVLDAAGAVISHVSERRDKTLWSSRKGGAPIETFTGQTGREEAAWVARRIRRLVGAGEADWAECAIFYRTNSQSRVIEEQLQAAGVPYGMVGGKSFYARREVKDVLAYLRVAVNPSNGLALKRILNTPRRSIGKKTVAKLERLVGDGGVVGSLYDAIDYALNADGVLTTRQIKPLRAFLTLMDGLRMLVREGLGPAALVREVIERTDYMAWLERDDASSALERQASLEELVVSLAEASQDIADVPEDATPETKLTAFLERAALNAEPPKDPDTLAALGPEARVQMMTVHASKGLEFDAVFVVGLEERRFPLLRDDNPDDPEREARLDEERRLFYVALTRARHRLFLSNAAQRTTFDRDNARRSPTSPSRFLGDIPPELLKVARESVKREVMWGEPPSDPLDWVDREHAQTHWAGDLNHTHTRRRARRSRNATPDPPSNPFPEVVYDADPAPDWDALTVAQRAAQSSPNRRARRGGLLGRAARRRAVPEPTPDPHEPEVVIEYEPGWDTADTVDHTLANIDRNAASGGDDGELVGRMVSHAREGLGEIMEVRGSGPKASLRVRFAMSGRELTIVRKFVKLY